MLAKRGHFSGRLKWVIREKEERARTGKRSSFDASHTRNWKDGGDQAGRLEESAKEEGLDIFTGGQYLQEDKRTGEKKQERKIEISNGGDKRPLVVIA